MAPEEIKKLIQDIDKLKKPYHRLLYRVLRKTRPETFFPSTGNETRFNIYSLIDYERDVLAKNVEFCLKHQNSIINFEKDIFGKN